MRNLLISLMLLVAVDSRHWSITWTPHPQNILLQVITDCSGNGSYRAISRYTISPEDSHAVVFRPETPPRSFCYVTAEVLRGTDGDVEGESVGESAVTTTQE